MDSSASTVAPITVTALYVAPERHAPMQARTHIEVEAGRGVVGDRFHGSRHRHVTVQSAESLAEAATRLGAAVPPEATRRTITLSHGVVPAVPGDRLRIGEVELEVVRIAAPCRIMDDTLGPGGAAALRRRGGSVCRALTSGVVRLGDPVDLGDPTQLGPGSGPV